MRSRTKGRLYIGVPFACPRTRRRFESEAALKPINLVQKLALFSSHWDPHVIADYKENEVMVVKFKGEFP